MGEFAVSIETWGDGVDAFPVELVEGLPHVLSELGGFGASVGVGGLAGGVSAQFTVESEGSGPDAPSVDALRLGVIVFTDGCEKLGLKHGGIARAEVMTEAYLDRELEEEPDRFLGVTEVAGLLGVSKQRVSELRATVAFPAPIAELAAGPVWKERSLRRFVAGWERKPGRPRRAKATA
jgi:hypothetical protein